jgi:uncharacterized protein
MAAETDLQQMIKNMKPQLNYGAYVFCTLPHLHNLNMGNVLMSFREAEAYTIIINQEIADELNLTYLDTYGWITLTVHSALNAVGLTAAFSNALAQNNISCNVVAAFYHDHIFVPIADAQKALHILDQLSQQ